MKRRSIIALLLFTALLARTGGSARSTSSGPQADTTSPAFWSLVIEAYITGAHDSLASLGVRPDATTDYDPQYEVPRPPPPPGMSVQVYFPHTGGNWPGMLGDKFAIDRTDPRAPAWRMSVETNAGGVPVTLAWDTLDIAALPGSYFLMMRDSAIDSLIDLRHDTSYTFTYTEPRIFLIEAEFASTFIETGPGWNILSLPREVTDRTVESLFPDAVAGAYRFDGAYVGTDSLDPGPGYWLKFPSAQLRALTGVGADSLDIPLTEGWNLVGTISEAIPAPVQPELVTPFYEYVAGYHRVDSLTPGKGYWVKSSPAAVLALRPSPPEAGPRTTASPSEESRTMTLTVRASHGGTAELLLIDGMAPGDRAPFDLPPAPPSPAFDARFAGGTSAGPLPAAGEGGTDIVVQDERGDFFLGAAGFAGAPQLEVQTGPDQWKAIPEISEPVALSLGPGRHFLRVRAAATGAPDRSFRLEGCYPNPFNPSTTIVWTLPEAAVLAVTVSDVAGRGVFRGPEVRADAGRGSFRFDAGPAGLAAGTYYYVVEARGGSGTLYRASGKFVFVK